MTTAYEALIRSGAIGSLKRDILMEAADDIWYLCHIHSWFQEDAGSEVALIADEGTVRVVEELIHNNFCSFATWGADSQANEAIKPDHDELLALVRHIILPDSNPFEHFLIATDKGKDWVRRHRDLVNEL